VVGREIERIALELVGVFQSTSPHRHTSLWGDFAVAVSDHLGMIEFTADWVIDEMHGQ
jgi:hypothetical protein